MNSRERRRRIREGLPSLLARIAAARLVGSLPDRLIDGLAATAKDPKLKLRHLEGANRTLSRYESLYEDGPLPRRIVAAKPALGARYSGRSAHIIIIDEATAFK